jgi:hypothetical protein
MGILHAVALSFPAIHNEFEESCIFIMNKEYMSRAVILQQLLDEQ